MMFFFLLKLEVSYILHKHFARLSLLAYSVGGLFSGVLFLKWNSQKTIASPLAAE